MSTLTQPGVKTVSLTTLAGPTDNTNNTQGVKNLIGEVKYRFLYDHLSIIYSEKLTGKFLLCVVREEMGR